MLGLAAQRTIGNFIAGLLIAFTQPVRLGDVVELGDGGVVEEIGSPTRGTCTAEQRPARDPEREARLQDDPQCHDPQPAALAEVTVQVPLTADLRGLVAALERDSAEAYVTDLSGDATIAVRTWARRRLADRASSDLRLPCTTVSASSGIVGRPEMPRPPRPTPPLALVGGARRLTGAAAAREVRRRRRAGDRSRGAPRDRRTAR